MNLIYEIHKRQLQPFMRNYTKKPQIIKLSIASDGHNFRFGRPFAKLFALCYKTVVCLSVCLSCLSETLVYCGQTIGWIRMLLGMEVSLGPGHIVLDGDPAPSPRAAQPPIFGPHICCGQTAGWRTLKFFKIILF